MTYTERNSQSGVSLIELTIVMAVMFPILAGLAMTTKSVNGTMEANSRSADVNTYCRRVLARVAKIIRPAQMSTLRVQAVEEDVKALRAKAVGEWISPTDLVWRPGLEFRSATGLLTMNASMSTSIRRAVFVMDANEIANNLDDDGDGLIDEGRIQLLQDGVTRDILRDVEGLTFMLDGRMIKIRLKVARRGADRRQFRFMTESEFYIRNN